MEDKTLELMIKELSVTLYTELSDTEKFIFCSNLSDLLHLPPSSVLTSIKTLYTRLADCKNSIKEVDYYTKFTENEGYQKAMQKLDSEIRSHIKHELQMNVFIDRLEEKLSKAKPGKNPSFDKSETKEKLLIENKILKSSLNNKINEIAELKKLTSAVCEKEIRELKEKNAKDCEKILEVGAENLKIRQKCEQAKIELDFMNTECERHKKEFLNLKNVVRNFEVRNKSIEKKETAKTTGSNTSRISRTPTKLINPTSPPRSSSKSATKKNPTATRSANKLEKTPLLSVLKKELTKSKTKPKLQQYLNTKPKLI